MRLPWGAVRERAAFPESVDISVNNKPGAFVLQMIFAEFTVLAEKKIELVVDTQVLVIDHAVDVTVISYRPRISNLLTRLRFGFG